MITCYDDQDKYEAAEALLAMSHWQNEQFVRDITNPYDFLRDFDRWFKFAKRRAEQISRVHRRDATDGFVFRNCTFVTGGSPEDLAAAALAAGAPGVTYGTYQK